MGTKAYLMINVDRQIAQQGDYYIRMVSELEAIPEVEFVEPVSGVYDLLVKVDAPIMAIFVANKILAKEWVRRLHVLRVEPVEREKGKHMEHKGGSEPSVEGAV